MLSSGPNWFQNLSSSIGDVWKLAKESYYHGEMKPKRMGQVKGIESFSWQTEAQIRHGVIERDLDKFFKLKVFFLAQSCTEGLTNFFI